MKKSSWYRDFTAPGETRDLTHELSSDHFGKFRHYFRMPLSKVEALADTLIERDYVWFPRTRCCLFIYWGQVLRFAPVDRCAR